MTEEAFARLVQDSNKRALSWRGGNTRSQLQLCLFLPNQENGGRIQLYSPDRQRKNIRTLAFWGFLNITAHSGLLLVTSIVSGKQCLIHLI